MGHCLADDYSQRGEEPGAMGDVGLAAIAEVFNGIIKGIFQGWFGDDGQLVSECAVPECICVFHR